MKKEPKAYMEEIYENIAEKTIESLKKEKATKISRRTLKLIALTQSLSNYVIR